MAASKKGRTRKTSERCLMYTPAQVAAGLHVPNRLQQQQPTTGRRSSNQSPQRPKRWSQPSGGRLSSQGGQGRGPSRRSSTHQGSIKQHDPSQPVEKEPPGFSLQFSYSDTVQSYSDILAVWQQSRSSACKRDWSQMKVLLHNLQEVYFESRRSDRPPDDWEQIERLILGIDDDERKVTRGAAGGRGRPYIGWSRPADSPVVTCDVIHCGARRSSSCPPLPDLFRKSIPTRTTDDYTSDSPRTSRTHRDLTSGRSDGQVRFSLPAMISSHEQTAKVKTPRRNTTHLPPVKNKLK